MNGVRKQRLIILIAALVGLSVATGLSIYALRQNMNLYYSPADVVSGKAPVGQKMRIGGLVKKGTLVRDPKTLGVTFTVTDGVHHFQVHYQGILPDLFREGQGVVANGTLVSPDLFEASQVLAKHDEKYQPPEVKEALKEGREAKNESGHYPG